MLSSIVSWFRSITDYELVWSWRILLLLAAGVTAFSSSLIAVTFAWSQIQVFLLAKNAGL